MNILGPSIDSLNEITFKNRNKNYGAYVIRSTYDQTVLKSLLITASLFVGIAFGSMLLRKTEEEKIAVPLSGNIPVCPTYSTEIYIQPPAPASRPVEHRRTASSAAASNQNYIVRDEPVEQINNMPANNPLAAPGDQGTEVDIPGSPGTGEPATGTENGTGSPDNIVLIPDVMPKIPNLTGFLGKNIQYPLRAKEENISGKVVISFIVDENGHIQDARVEKGIGYGCDEEALRVIKMIPNAIPGYVNGKPVKVRFAQVINFSLR